MSDPYADTIIVRNILNHVISPKIVSDGSGGYTTKVDLVNVDTIRLNTTGGNGALSTPFTGQVGTIVGNGTTSITIYHSGVTSGSIILVSLRNGSGQYVTNITSTTGQFTITFNSSVSSSISIIWFIAKF